MTHTPAATVATPTQAEPANPTVFLPATHPAWGHYPSTVGDVADVLVFDTETTGVDFEDDRVVTVHVSRLARGERTVRDRLDLVVDAGVTIPDEAAAIHGVSNERRIADGVSERYGVGLVAARIQHAVDAGVPVVAFNAAFDFTMIARALDRLGDPPMRLEHAVILDPFVIDKAADKYRRGSRRLVNVAAHYGVTFDEADAHDADADAAAAGLVLYAMADRIPAVANLRLDDVSRGQQVSFREQAAGLEDYFRRQGTLDGRLNKHWPVAASPHRA